NNNNDNAPAERLDDQAEGWLGEAYTKAQGSAISVAEEVIAQDGVASDARIEMLASDLGINPSEAKARVEHVVKSYSDEAIRVSARNVGTTPDIVAEAFAWANYEQDPALKQAAQNHYQTGKARYEGIVRGYISSLAERAPDQ